MVLRIVVLFLLFAEIIPMAAYGPVLQMYSGAVKIYICILIGL